MTHDTRIRVEGGENFRIQSGGPFTRIIEDFISYYRNTPMENIPKHRNYNLCPRDCLPREENYSYLDVLKLAIEDEVFNPGRIAQFTNLFSPTPEQFFSSNNIRVAAAHGILDIMWREAIRAHYPLTRDLFIERSDHPSFPLTAIEWACGYADSLKQLAKVAKYYKWQLKRNDVTTKIANQGIVDTGIRTAAIRGVLPELMKLGKVYGWSINSEDLKGQQTISLMTAYGYLPQLCKMAKKNGWHISLHDLVEEDRWGRNGIDFAIEKGHLKTVFKLAKDHDWNLSKMFDPVVWGGKREKMEMLWQGLKQYGRVDDLNVQTKQGILKGEQAYRHLYNQTIKQEQCTTFMSPHDIDVLRLHRQQVRRVAQLN